MCCFKNKSISKSDIHTKSYETYCFFCGNPSDFILTYGIHHVYQPIDLSVHLKKNEHTCRPIYSDFVIQVYSLPMAKPDSHCIDTVHKEFVHTESHTFSSPICYHSLFFLIIFLFRVNQAIEKSKSKVKISPELDTGESHL